MSLVQFRLWAPSISAGGAKFSFIIGFPLFTNLTQLDLTGPQEVLSRISGAQCLLLSHDLTPVKSQSGVSILPTALYRDAPALDMICMPGGPGHIQAMQDRDLLAFLRQQASGCRYVTSVCTGALILAAAGLLDGYRATTHWMSLDRLAAFGAIPTHDRVVFDRNRITGGGVTAGIDFALSIVAEISGADIAKEIQLQIEYAPAPPFVCGDPATAGDALVAQLRERLKAYAEKMIETDKKALDNLRNLKRT